MAKADTATRRIPFALRMRRIFLSNWAPPFDHVRFESRLESNLSKLPKVLQETFTDLEKRCKIPT